MLANAVLKTMNMFFLQPDKLLSSKIQSLCPTISGNICCNLEQFETLRSQVQQVWPIIQFMKLLLAWKFVSSFLNWYRTYCLFLCLQFYVGDSISCWMPSMFEEFPQPLLWDVVLSKSKPLHQCHFYPEGQ